MDIGSPNRWRRNGHADANGGDCEENSADNGHAQLWHRIIVSVAREGEALKDF
jgi:hypothetical protein